MADENGSRFISARKMQILFVLLLLKARQVVSIDEVIAEIWGDEPPRRATAGVHVYISQLRKLLGRPDRPDNPIATRPPGYLFQFYGAEFDVTQFQDLLYEGRGHMKTRRHEEAAQSFTAALKLWRGPVLIDLCGGPVIEGFAVWLEEARLECTEMLMESQLNLGRHRELVGQLYSLTGEHALRETFYRQLMLALCRSERQADALRVYRQARSRLNEELGLEPCRALRDLQQAILNEDERLQLPTAVGPAQAAL